MYFDVKGKRVFATTGGKPFDNSLPCIIFLHGSGLDHTFWGLHSRFFAFRRYAVLAPDLPGHSHSEGPPLRSIEEIGEWLNDVVEAPNPHLRRFHRQITASDASFQLQNKIATYVVCSLFFA